LLTLRASNPAGNSADDAPPLRIAIQAPGNLDPALLKDHSANLVARQINEPLLRFDSTTLGLVPALAEKWQVHDAGARFVFTLKRGAKFHNGQPVVAEDVRYSLSRLARKSTQSELAFLLDSVAGFEAVSITGAAAELAGISVLNDRDVEIRLKEPWLDFPYVLTHPATAPVPKKDFEAGPEVFKTAPVGTGPYRLTSAVAHGQDFAIDAVRPAEHAPHRVQFKIYDDPEGAWRDFNRGLVDVVETPARFVDDARSRFGPGGFQPVAAGIYLGINVKKIPDIRVRRAIALSINRSAIAEQVYAGALLPSANLIPAGIKGRNRTACGDLCKLNPKRAAFLLRETYGDAPRPALTLDFEANPTNDLFAARIKEDLAAAGLTVNLQGRDLPGFFGALGEHNHDLFRFGWVAEYPLADWFLNPLFRSGSLDNNTGFSSPEIDAALAAARANSRTTARLEAYRDLERRLLQEVAVVGIGQFRSRWAASQRVGDFFADQLGGFDVSRLDVRAP